MSADIPSRVVVVGAGFTGLSAATELERAGIDFVLLEARDRVGGRVEAKMNNLDDLYDTGGQFICDDMPEIMALARTPRQDISRNTGSG